MICLAFEEICCGGQLIAWGFSLYRWPNKDASVSLCDRRILLMKLGHIPFLFLIKTGGDQRRAAALGGLRVSTAVQWRVDSPSSGPWTP